MGALKWEVALRKGRVLEAVPAFGWEVCAVSTSKSLFLGLSLNSLGICHNCLTVSCEYPLLEC